MPPPPTRRRWFQFELRKTFIGACFGFSLGIVVGNVINFLFFWSFNGPAQGVGVPIEEINIIADMAHRLVPATGITGALIGAWAGWKFGKTRLPCQPSEASVSD